MRAVRRPWWVMVDYQRVVKIGRWATNLLLGEIRSINKKLPFRWERQNKATGWSIDAAPAISKGLLALRPALVRDDLRHSDLMARYHIEVSHSTYAKRRPVTGPSEAENL